MEVVHFFSDKKLHGIEVVLVLVDVRKGFSVPILIFLIKKFLNLHYWKIFRNK